MYVCVYIYIYIHIIMYYMSGQLRRPGVGHAASLGRGLEQVGVPGSSLGPAGSRRVLGGSLGSSCSHERQDLGGMSTLQSRASGFPSTTQGSPSGPKKDSSESENKQKTPRPGSETSARVPWTAREGGLPPSPAPASRGAEALVLTHI